MKSLADLNTSDFEDPEMKEIVEQLKAMNQNLSRMEQKFDMKFDGLEQKVDRLDTKLSSKIDGVTQRLDTLVPIVIAIHDREGTYDSAIDYLEGGFPDGVIQTAREITAKDRKD